MTGRVVVVVAAALALGIPSGAVEAQDFTFGPRVGFGVSLGSFIVGAQGHTPISSIENLSFEPVAQVSFGDNFKNYELAGRARYDIQEDNDLTIFGFAGISLFRFSVDGTIDLGLTTNTQQAAGGSAALAAAARQEIDISGSETDVALILGAGVEKNGLGAEAAFGVSAVSDLQLMLRYRFGWNN